MELLWQSRDGYVKVVDGVEFLEEDGSGTGDLSNLFGSGAWIVVWRSSGRWHFTRNRRYAKPGMQALRRVMRQQGETDMADMAWIAATDAHGHLYNEWSDPVAFGQALYAAWGILAADALPAKVAYLGLNADEPPVEQIPAWMRPGLPEYQRRRQEMRELLIELAE